MPKFKSLLLGSSSEDEDDPASNEFGGGSDDDVVVVDPPWPLVPIASLSDGTCNASCRETTGRAATAADGGADPTKRPATEAPSQETSGKRPALPNKMGEPSCRPNYPILGDSYAINGYDSAALDCDLQEWRNVVGRSTVWTDPSFPPNQLSIDGPSRAPAPGSTVEAGKTPPVCRCKTEASRSAVKGDTPNKGRPYFHCSSRKCGFFLWADGEQRSQARKRLSWSRFPSLPIVTDFGFSAADLRQGGVGDCWFLSALAVVAERHDLIASLFSSTVTNSTGCYNIRLFLDGQWTSVLVDDHLPVTEAPRRPELAFESRLAFSRCGSPVGGQQLWVSLLEKAYAKAHGCYDAISGGQISEALLDLTGAPTEDIDMGSHSFDSELLWRRLCEFRRLKLPMGCATDSDHSTLSEVGLCGSHAYSILDVREAMVSPHGDESFGGDGVVESVRLLRIRNPHGVGEWNGEWSDKSTNWSRVLFPPGEGSQGDEIERPTGVDDGTFWMEYTTFMMGFSRVDVCFAHRGWHARSLPSTFPPSCEKLWRLCSTAYIVKNSEECLDTIVHITALQPTQRGSKKGRIDRKKSYRTGDVSIMVVKLSAHSGGVLSIVAFELAGAGERTFVTAVLESDPGLLYAIVPICLGSAPTAAEVTKDQPFIIRIFSEHPLTAQPWNPQAALPSRELQAKGGVFSNPLQAIFSAWHLALVSSVDPHNLLLPDRRAASEIISGGSSRSSKNGIDESSSAAARPRIRPFALPRTDIHRRIVKVSAGVGLLAIRGNGVVVLMAFNRTVYPAIVRVSVTAKSNVARSEAGVLTSDQQLADAYCCSLPPLPPAASGVYRPRWPVKWKAFRSQCLVKPSEQRVVMILTKSGAMAELGSIECEIVHNPEAPHEQLSSTSSTTKQPSLKRWFKGGCDEGPQYGLFTPTTLDTSQVDRYFYPNQFFHAAASGSDSLAAAIEASRRLHENRDEEALVQAVIASTEPGTGLTLPDVPWTCKSCTFLNEKAFALACEMCGDAKCDDPEIIPSCSAGGNPSADMSGSIGSKQISAADSRAACIEARLRRFDKKNDSF